MEEKPRNTRKSKGLRGKGFYVAMYSSLGGLLVLALVVGYYNFLGPGSSQNEVAVVQNADDFFTQGQAGFEDIPVGAGWGESAIGAATPTPQPSPTPQANLEEDVRTPEPQASPLPTPGQTSEVPVSADEEFFDEIGLTDEIHLAEDDTDDNMAEETAENNEADIYNVFDTVQTPVQQFAHFTEGDNMHWPILGDVVMDFAMDRLVFDITLDQWRTNNNIAISANRGDAVRAAAAGQVKDIVQSREFGPTVVIDHGNGWLTTYSQLEPDFAVSVGDVVNRGQIIGAVGSPSIFSSLLGYHVSFTVLNDDTPVDPTTLLTTAEQ